MNYFPITLAGGKAFCNRLEELKRISYNLKIGNPTLLVSPRRYGKTSLAIHAFEEIKIPYAHIDLYKALSEEDIAQFILNGIGKLLGRIESTPKTLIKTATEFFSGFQVKFVLEKFGLSVEFAQKKKKTTELVLTALERLDTLTAKRKKSIILFLDEFQVLAEVMTNNSMEAAIREAVQKSKNVRYVFSGSNRHLIEVMFNDKKRPFYNLCDTIFLNRIDKKHYISHINKASINRWDKELSEPVIEEIFNVTEFHSYYINKLCSLLWQHLNPIKEKDVSDTWNQYVLENKPGIERELSLLSVNQRKLMIYIANEEENVFKPFGKKHSNNWLMSSTSIHRAMEWLLEKDYIYIDHNKAYRILDPLMKSVLQKN